MYRSTQRWAVGYDEVIVGDFDGDGFLNDLFIWDQDTGNWVIHSMSGFRPTYRCRGTPRRPTTSWSSATGTTTAGSTTSCSGTPTAGCGSCRASPAFRPTFRRSGRWAVGYDAAITGDWNGDGRRDDLVFVNFDNGSTVVHTWSNFVPAYRGNAQFSSTFDLGVAADLDDDGRHNELLLFDRDAFQWQIHTYRQFSPVLARAGTWTVGYDALLDGTWG